MVNNFKNIEPYIKEVEGGFYFVQIIKRKKDNPDSGLRSDKVIGEYLISNIEYFRKKEKEIIDVCDKNNARASIRINRRSYEKVAYKMSRELPVLIEEKRFREVKSLFASMAGKYMDDPIKKWMLDIDDSDADDLNLGLELLDFVTNAAPVGSKLIGFIPSKTGKHMITKPFDPRGFKDRFPTIGIHKDGPTNLYIP